MSVLKYCLVCSLLLGIGSCLRLRVDQAALGRLARLNRTSGLNTRLNNNNNEGKVNLKANIKGWHIHVTMHVYSGRLDPTWFIPDSHPSYNAILRNMGAIPAKPLPSRLGYKGFSLAHVPPGESVVTGHHYNQTVTLFPDWEMFLLQTSEGLDEGLKAHAKYAILNSVEQRKRRSNSLYYPDYDLSSLLGINSKADPINSLTDDDMYKLAQLWGLDKRFKNITTVPPPVGATRFEPEKWNKYLVKEHNNCYNYANDRITDTFAQPGRAGDCEMDAFMIHGTKIGKLAQCDGLETVFAPDLNKLPSHDLNLVALVFWPPKPGSVEFDFHWYRQDRDGRWSHKPGKTAATNVDQSEKPIFDPRRADRGPYTEFIGFLQTRQDKVILL